MMKLFYRLSKTDPAIAARCNSRARMHQRSLGLFVLLTASFAFLSGYYALMTIFGAWDELNRIYVLSYKDQLIVAVCALLYALMIAAIDRDIVSARNKTAALCRIPLAIVIGVVVSVPLKLKILEGRINQQIKQEQISSMLPFKQEQDRFIAQSDSVIRNLEVQISQYSKLKLEEQKRMEAEDLGLLGDGLSGIAGQGTRFGYARRNVENYNSLINGLKTKIREEKEYKEERMSQLQNDSRRYRTDAVYDFWSRYEAMHRLVKQDPSAQSRLMIWGLTLLFILLELVPSIMKLLAPESEYEMLNSYLDGVIRKKLERSLDEPEEEMDMEGFIPMPEIQAV